MDLSHWCGQRTWWTSEKREKGNSCLDFMYFCSFKRQETISFNSFSCTYFQLIALQNVENEIKWEDMQNSSELFFMNGAVLFSYWFSMCVLTLKWIWWESKINMSQNLHTGCSSVWGSIYAFPKCTGLSLPSTRKAYMRSQW